MFQNLKDSYFTDKNYSLIYTHHFFRSMSSAAMYIFTGAYFLKLGMPLHFVLLFYGLEFGMRGILCPFGIAFLNKVGLVKAQLVSAIFLFLFFVGLSFSNQNLVIGFFSLFLAAISNAIHNTFNANLEALYIKEDNNRTK